MKIDEERLQEVAMALLSLTMFEDNTGTRAWKSMDWDLLDALHERGWISDPKSKAKSVAVSSKGELAAREFFRKYFEAHPE